MQKKSKIVHPTSICTPALPHSLPLFSQLYGAPCFQHTAPRGNLHFNRQGTVSEPKYALRRTAGKRTQLHMFPMNPPRQFRGPGRKRIFLAAGSLPSAAISYRRVCTPTYRQIQRGSIKEDPVARN